VANKEEKIDKIKKVVVPGAAAKPNSTEDASRLE
jgi:hypothetical protein